MEINAEEDESGENENNVEELKVKEIGDNPDETINKTSSDEEDGKGKTRIGRKTRKPDWLGNNKLASTVEHQMRAKKRRLKKKRTLSQNLC